MRPTRDISLWMEATPRGGFPALEGEIECDVVIVGGGIAGVMCALQLAEKGRSVVIVERDDVASGASGRSMAKVTAAHSFKYAPVLSTYGTEVVRAHAHANRDGFERVLDVVERYGIDCGLERDSNLTISSRSEDSSELTSEWRALQVAGFSVQNVSQGDSPFEIVSAIESVDQARMNPRAFTVGVARAIEGLGGRVFVNSEVVGVELSDAPDLAVTVRTPQGSVRAAHVVIATNAPAHVEGAFRDSLDPWFGHVAAFPADESMRFAMGYRHSGDVSSHRLHGHHDARYLLLGGGDASDAQASDERHFEAIGRWAREEMGLSEPSFQWTCHDVYTPDQLPVVGSVDGADRIIVITGFCAWGMTKSASAASVVSDIIEGNDNPLIDIYRPARPALTHASGTDGAVVSDEGTVVERDGRKLAVYVDSAGATYTLLARCPHKGCTVGWNATERVWDCPCHGSRFAPNGELLRGPAKRGLDSVESQE